MGMKKLLTIDQLTYWAISLTVMENSICMLIVINVINFHQT